MQSLDVVMEHDKWLSCKFAETADSEIFILFSIKSDFFQAKLSQIWSLFLYLYN